MEKAVACPTNTVTARQMSRRVPLMTAPRRRKMGTALEMVLGGGSLLDDDDPDQGAT